MKEQIKQALDKATQGKWCEFEKEHVKNDKGTYRSISSGRGYFDDDTETGFSFDAYISKHDAHLIANSPEWLRWQNECIEQLEQEVLKYRTEAANERELSEDIVGEREELYIRVGQLDKALEMAMPIVEHNSPTLAMEINKALRKKDNPMKEIDKAIQKLLDGEEKPKDVRFSVSFSTEETERIERVLGRIGTSKQKFVHTITMAAIEDIERRNNP